MPSAVICSPEIELKDGVTAGMTREDFITRFPRVENYTGANEFRLHLYPFARLCIMTFTFEENKIKSIKLEIAQQDFGWLIVKLRKIKFDRL